MTSRDRVRLTVAEARALGEAIARRMGYAAAEATIIAEHVVNAALCGYEYSGLPKLLDAVEDRRCGEARGPIRVLRETTVSVLLDGGNNIGMFAMVRLAEAVAAKAVAAGFAVGAMRNSWMSGRGAHYVEKLVQAGLVAVHAVGISGRVAPPGGAEPLLGTNPMTIGLPCEGHPLIFDMGTSAIMHTDLTLRARRGEPLPEGVAIDARGAPTRDPHAALAGSLLHFGGHKGFGLALMMQGLALLAGAGGGPGKDYGYLLIAFRPDLLVPLEEYRRDVARLVRRAKAVRRLPGVEEIRIPSERSFRERQRQLLEGIEIDAAIHAQLLRHASGRVPPFTP